MHDDHRPTTGFFDPAAARAMRDAVKAGRHAVTPPKTEGDPMRAGFLNPAAAGARYRYELFLRDLRRGVHHIPQQQGGEVVSLADHREPLILREPVGAGGNPRSEHVCGSNVAQQHVGERHQMRVDTVEVFGRPIVHSISPFVLLSVVWGIAGILWGANIALWVFA